MYIFTLPSGLRFLHIANNSSVSHFGIMINAGTRDENPYENGCAHLIEHSLFKGTKNQSSKSISIAFDHIGAEINAYTTKEDTCFHFSFLSEYYPKIMKTCADMLFNSCFPEKEIVKEINVIKEEILSCLDSPAESIFDDFENNLFNGHSIGRNILGTNESLDNIIHNLNIVKGFYEENYLNNEIIIWSNGNLTDKRFRFLCEKYFGDSPLKSTQRNRTTVGKNSRFDVVEDKEIFQCNTIIGGNAYSFFDKGREAFTLLNFMLGNDGLSSQLNYQVREKYGLVYHIESSYNPYCDTGAFSIFYECEYANNERVRNIVLKELNKCKNNLLGTNKLSTAKKQLKGSLAVAADSRLNDTISSAKSLLVFNKVEPMENVFKKIDGITSEEILSVANEIFSEDNISQLVYRPQDNETT